MSERVDVVVVGAGAHGSATAWWLAKEGRSVVLLEQFEPGHRRGSSHGGSRIFRVAYDDPWYVELAREALVLWWELEMASGATLLDQTGGLDWGDETSVAAVAKALDEAGLDHEMLDPGAARDRWPGFAFATPVLFSPDAGRLRADLTMSVLHNLVPDVRYGVAVDGVEEGRVVLEDGHRIECGATVVTAGAWVKDFAPDLPLQVTQEQVFHFAPRDGTLWPSFIHHGEPAVYGLETLGEGVKVAEHHTGTQLDHPDSRDFQVDAFKRERLVDFVRSHIPGLAPTPVTEATCLYTSTPDESFVLERRDGNVVIGSACSGHGFKFTPAIGRRLATMAIEALDS